MTPTERALWLRLQRRAGALEPQIANAMLKAVRTIAENFSESQIAQMIATGQIDRVIAVAFNDAILNSAYAPVREKMRDGMRDGAKYFARDLPKPPSSVPGSISFAFDSLSPNVITAITQLETKVIRTLKDDTREVVRAHIENGLRDGTHPRTVARDLRKVLGLAPNQLAAVENYRKSLESGNVSKALRYKLRDKRLAVRKDMTPAQIGKAVDAYRRKMVAFNAETNARTAALDAQKLAQRLSWEQAASQGIVDRRRLVKTWAGTLDERERETHREMENVTVGFDEVFVLPDGQQQMVPGDTEYNCRCIARYHQMRAA